MSRWDQEDQPDWGDEEDHIRFADPGGRSSLRAGVRSRRCPSCLQPRRLTPEDVRLGYQCDECADRTERGWDP